MIYHNRKIDAVAFRRVLVDSVVMRVAEFYGVPVTALKGRSRHAEIVAARHAAWAILYYRMRLPCVPLGRYFGVNHTSICYGADKGILQPLEAISQGRMNPSQSRDQLPSTEKSK